MYNPLRKIAILFSSVLVVGLIFFHFNTLVDFGARFLPVQIVRLLSQDVSAANVCTATVNDTIPVWYQDAADGNKMKLRDSTMTHSESLGLLTITGNQGIRFSSTVNNYGFLNSRGAMHISQNAYFDGSAWNFIDVNSFSGQAATIQTNVGSTEAMRISADTDGATGGMAFTPLFVVKTNGRTSLGPSNITPDGMLDINSTGVLAEWGGWNAAINFSNGSHNAIVNPAGELLFGLHSNNNFYWADTSGADAGYKMTLNAATGNLDIAGALTSDGNTVIDNGGGWHRSYGDAGWYSQTYGGGIYMTDTTWVRTYANKAFYVNNTIRADGDLRSPIFYDQDNTGFYVDPNSVSRVKSLYQTDSPNTAYTIIGMGSDYGVTGPKGVVQYNGNYIYPGRVDSAAWNYSWALGSHGSYGLYTSTGFYIGGGLYTGSWSDINDGNYYVDPNQTSAFNDLRTNILYERSNTSYYVDPGGTSMVNKFNAGVYNAGGGAGNLNAYSLEVGGSSNSTNGQATIFFHHHGASAHQLRYSSGTFYFERAGNGYGTTNTPALWVGGAVNANQASDARYKKNVKPISNALDTLEKFNAITYQWTDPSAVGIDEEPGKTHMGFLAQEVQKIFPDWIYINEDGKYFIKDNVDTKLGFQALLVQAIKELQASYEAFKAAVTARVDTLDKNQQAQQKNIEAQQKIIDMQQKQIEALEKRIEKLEKK